MSKDTTVTDGINSPALNDEIEIQEWSMKSTREGKGRKRF